MGLDVTELDGNAIYDALISEKDRPIPILYALNQMDLSANILLTNAEQV